MYRNKLCHVQCYLDLEIFTGIFEMSPWIKQDYCPHAQYNGMWQTHEDHADLERAILCFLNEFEACSTGGNQFLIL